jgi:transposase InsO family protein
MNRAPERHPNQTQAATEEAVLGLRQAHMTWGPRNRPSDEDLSLGTPKLKHVLERDQPGRIWPATSTVGEIVKHAGLVVARKKRRETEPYTAPLAHAVASNRVWCADFKGWFQAGDGTSVDPLTITDASGAACTLLNCA